MLTSFASLALLATLPLTPPPAPSLLANQSPAAACAEAGGFWIIDHCSKFTSNATDGGGLNTTDANWESRILAYQKTQKQKVATTTNTDDAVSNNRENSPADADPSPDPCTFKTFNNFEDGDPLLQGHKASDGYVVIPFCPQALDIGNQQLTNIQQENAIFVPNGQAPPRTPPPPDPTDLAEQATALLTIPAPAPHLGPNVEQAVVHKPLWMWVTDPGQLTSGVTLRGVTVNAVATLQKTEWDMGEPVDQPSPLKQQATATVSCDGPGSQPPNDTASAKTDDAKGCSYAYQWKSTCKRTGNLGRWTVTARATWQVDWTSNVGVGGSTTLQTTGTTTVEVGELRSVLVNDPSAKLPPTHRAC